VLSRTADYNGRMRTWIGLALAFLCGCAASGASRARPAEAPMDETRTFGPSHTIYWR